MPLSGTGGRLGGGGTPRTAPPQGGPSTSVGVELASGRARVFVHKRPEEQHWLLQCRWALHTGGPGCGRRGSSRFCLHIRCGCFASPLHHHVPAITALSSARTAAPLHGMLKKKKNEKKKVGGKSHCGISSQAWSNKARTKVTPKQSDTATARCSFNNWHNALPAALLRRTAVQLPARAGSCCGCGGYKYKLLTSATTVVCRSSSISNSLTALGSTLNAQGNKATFNK